MSLFLAPIHPRVCGELERDQYSRMAEDGPSLGGDRGGPGACGPQPGGGSLSRSDLFDGRRVLMDDWARYLAQGAGEDPDLSDFPIDEPDEYQHYEWDNQADQVGDDEKGFGRSRHA